MVTVSKIAAAAFQRLLKGSELPANTKLRVRVGVETDSEQGDKRQVCLSFEPRPPSSNDVTQRSEGVELVIAQELANQLGEAQIDYTSQGAEEGSFVFRRSYTQ